MSRCARRSARKNLRRSSRSVSPWIIVPIMNVVSITLRKPSCSAIGSLDDPIGLKRATRLSRKNWHSPLNGAVLLLVLSAKCAPGSCPAGLFAEVGLRWWRQTMPHNRWRSRCLVDPRRPQRSAFPRSVPDPQRAQVSHGLFRLRSSQVRRRGLPQSNLASLRCCDRRVGQRLLR
jgi:hypothetical protein